MNWIFTIIGLICFFGFFGGIIYLAKKEANRPKTNKEQRKIRGYKNMKAY